MITAIFLSYPQSEKFSFSSRFANTDKKSNIIETSTTGVNYPVIYWNGR